MFPPRIRGTDTLCRTGVDNGRGALSLHGVKDAIINCFSKGGEKALIMADVILRGVDLRQVNYAQNIIVVYKLLLVNERDGFENKGVL